MMLRKFAFLACLSVATSQPGPTPLSPTAPNVMMIGDSISMGYFGCGLFVQDMLQIDNTTDKIVGSVQHGGGYGDGGQMGPSRDGVAKVTACIGNTTGSLKPKAWSVITYNAGLHDCANDTEHVLPADYRANLKAIFETLKPAAHAVAFVTTTPFDLPYPPPKWAGDPNMSCVLHRNSIAREVAREVGDIFIDDLHQYVEDFCNVPQNTVVAPGQPDAGNYSKCAVQTTGEHFYTVRPFPSGQQYTALSIANTMIRNLPAAQLWPPHAPLAQQFEPLEVVEAGANCGLEPKPLNRSVPNVLIIGDSISMTGSGYGPAVRHILENPINSSQGLTGALAAVQHSGGWIGEPGANEQAGPSSNGKVCAKSWVGSGGWDVITMNFGLHDCWSQQKVLPADYVANLEAIYDVARSGLAPGGKVIWVQTTPTSNNNSFHIANSCVNEYNELAAQLFQNKTDVVTADLYSAVTGVCGEVFSQCPLQKLDDIHFEPNGRQFTAVVMAHAIARELGPRWALLTANITHQHKRELLV